MSSDLTVNDAIVKAIVPMLYQIIDDLVDANPAVPKPLLVQARRILPGIYRNSFEKLKTT